jgi:hypothetical protein
MLLLVLLLRLLLRLLLLRLVFLLLLLLLLLPLQQNNAGQRQITLELQDRKNDKFFVCGTM